MRPGDPSIRLSSRSHSDRYPAVESSRPILLDYDEEALLDAREIDESNWEDEEWADAGGRRDGTRHAETVLTGG